MRKRTCRVLGEDVVEDTVTGEFVRVRIAIAAVLSVQQHQLRLALIELVVIAFLERDSSVRFVHVHRQRVANSLYLRANKSILHPVARVATSQDSATYRQVLPNRFQLFARVMIISSV